MTRENVSTASISEAAPLYSRFHKGLINVSFDGKADTGFKKTLKTRVDQYFNEKGISRKANGYMVFKAIFYVGGLIGLYAALVLGHFSDLTMLLMMVGLGLLIGGIGFNIGHDAIHGAFAKGPKLNKLISFGFELIGASSYMWNIRHNILHHTYTNVIGSDGDLESNPLMRFCVKPGRKWYHRYQHFYCHFLYAMMTLVWVFKKDYVHIFEERRDQRLNHKPPVSAYVTLFACKLLHFTLFLVVPIFGLKIALWKVLIGFLTMHFVAGYYMAIVFQMGHLVEGADLYDFPGDGVVHKSWAEHQLRTSANFGDSWLATWMCGGLNFHIEHHLFPTIGHGHNKAISKIVQKTAAEFNLPYINYKNFFSAFRSHLRMMKYFGRTDPKGYPAA